MGNVLKGERRVGFDLIGSGTVPRSSVKICLIFSCLFALLCFHRSSFQVEYWV